MIALILIALLALAAGAAAAWFLGAESGYVLLAWQHWTFETSLAGFALLLVVGAVGGWLLLRVISGAIGLPARMQAYWSNRRNVRTHRGFIEGLRALATGDYARAEQALLRRAANHEAPDLSYLAAARAAQELGAYDRRNHYLEQALAVGGDAEPPVLAERVRLLAMAGENERALEAARLYFERHPRRPHAVRLYAESLKAQQQFSALSALLREQGKQLPPERALRLGVEALGAQLDEASTAGRLDQFKALWDEAPGKLCNDPEALRRYVAGLHRLGAESEASDQVTRVLRSRWDAVLVSHFGQLEGIDPVAQLASLEAWVQQYGEQPELLLGAGRTCLRCRLWGKAGSYLEAALAAAPSAEAHLALARLAELTQKPDEAARHYRDGLTQVVGQPAA